MLKNYLLIAFRNVLKHKVFSFINIFGLAVGMAVCLLIMLMVADQLRYDNFHPNGDRIYRVLSKSRIYSNTVASTPLPLGEVLAKEYDVVEKSARLAGGLGGDLLYADKVASGGGYFADAGLFGVFNFGLAKGNPQTALQAPFSMVVSEEIATALFGNNDPLGKTIKFNHSGIHPNGLEAGNRETPYGEFTITGVLKKNEGKTHLPFKILASLATLKTLENEKKTGINATDSWKNVWTNYLYIIPKANKSPDDIQAALNQISKRQYLPKSGTEFDFALQALADITPLDVSINNATSMTVPKVVLVVLGILGLIVMLSACLNYTNLSVARALTRAKEVGIRKVVGAGRGQVFVQFIVEAMLMSLMALALAMGFLVFLKSAVAGMWVNKYLNISFEENIFIFALFVGFSLVVGLLAGVLPSVYVSAFNPIQVLKNFGGMKLFKRLTLRHALLVVQFCISLVFVISAIVLYAQLAHLLRAEYGFDKENTVNVKLFRTENYQRFAQRIQSRSDIAGVSACGYIPSTGYNMGGMAYKAENTKDSLHVAYLDIDPNFLAVWNIGLVAGKNFAAQASATGEQYTVINETMVKNFGYGSPQQAIGQKIVLDNQNLEVIGVSKDFHFQMLVDKIGPLVLRHRPDAYGYINVKLAKGQDAQAVVAALKSEWKRVNPESKFEYEFLDQQLLGMQSVMGDVAKVLGFLSFLAVLVSCLGLLGMAAYTAETRTKEVGVRKVLGASVPQIALLLSKNFALLLGLSVLVATPIAYIINTMWLELFAYRIQLGAGILLAGIACMLLISLGTVLSQTWRAARANPVRSLRSE